MGAVTAARLEIDIVSDVVCPWCIVGYKQLERALAETRLSAHIQWHPFELNPQMPAAGQDLREHIAEKYGSSAADSQRARETLTALGQALGFRFRFDDDSRIVNTFKAHQLIEWADEQGRQHDMKLALFTAHFSDAHDVSDPETLADIAAGIGLDRDAALAVLAEARFAATVRAMQQFWIERGIRGVPGMVFQKQHLVTGAQGVEAYSDLLTRLSAGER